MATKQMAYDHPAYIVPQPIGFVTSSGVPGRFQSATNLVIKSINVSNFSAVATNNSTHAIWSAFGTATTTLAVVTVGTATQASSVVGGTYGLATNTLINVVGIGVGTTTATVGSVIGSTPTGADTIILAIGIEAYVVPGSNLTV